MINILELCSGAKTIGISGHVKPDGDCVGSTTAMWQFLKKAMPDTKVELILQKPSIVFSCIKGYDELIEDISMLELEETMPQKQYDVMIICDSIPERTGMGAEYFKAAKTTINVDHHVSNLGCGMHNYIVPEASSAAELVYDLIEYADPKLQYMDVEIAKSIYLGMVHDTGVFQYSCTSPKTMRIAAKLMEYGFDFSELIDITFYQKTYVQNQIMGRAMLESLRFLDGKCIVSAIDRKTMNFYEATNQDFEGIVNQLRIIKGIEVAIFMYETDTLQHKVSLRSNGKVDVSKVATYFGGGGHVRASGCTMNGTFHDVVNNISKQIAMQLETV